MGEPLFWNPRVLHSLSIFTVKHHQYIVFQTDHLSFGWVQVHSAPTFLVRQTFISVTSQCTFSELPPTTLYNIPDLISLVWKRVPTRNICPVPAQMLPNALKLCVSLVPCNPYNNVYICLPICYISYTRIFKTFRIATFFFFFVHLNNLLFYPPGQLHTLIHITPLTYFSLVI